MLTYPIPICVTMNVPAVVARSTHPARDGSTSFGVVVKIWEMNRFDSQPHLLMRCSGLLLMLDVSNDALTSDVWLTSAEYRRYSDKVGRLTSVTSQRSEEEPEAHTFVP